ncbi:MAG: TetR/AcrR family transcriptional regulator [Phycisphaerales bacterium]|nr:TetR/AcrR family transcriptional regulator [Phycisphaerales bacterium]
MARPQKFEREELVERAMQVFWAKGYEASSMSDLTGAMGILSGSLYHIFGGKKALFLEALKRYDANIQGLFQSSLEKPGTGKDAISRLFVQVATFLGEDRARRGCLLSNTTLACTHPGDAALKIAESNRSFMENAFFEVLRQSQATGEMRKRSPGETRVLAQALVNALRGLHITAKTVHDAEKLRQIARASLEMLS